MRGIHALWRTVLLLTGLAMAGAGVVLLLTVGGLGAPTVLTWSGFELFADFRGLSLSERMPALLAGLALVVVGHLYFAMSVLRLAPPNRWIRLQGPARDGSGGGSVRVAMSGIESLAARSAEGVDGVREARSSMRLKKDGWVVTCNVVARSESIVPTLTDSVKQVVKASLELHTGLPVRRVDVRARLQPFGEGRLVH